MRVGGAFRSVYMREGLLVEGGVEVGETCSDGGERSGEIVRAGCL